MSCFQVATERMKACGISGSIVNMSTNGAKHVAPFPTAVYSSIKAGIDHLTECMAVELAPHKVCNRVTILTILFVVRVTSMPNLVLVLGSAYTDQCH